MATKRNSENKVVMSTGASAAPVRRKAAAPKRTARTSSSVEVIDTPVVKSSETVMEVTNEAVSQLAYSYWEARGFQGGSPEEDWLRAEQELCSVTASN